MRKAALRMVPALIAAGAFLLVPGAALAAEGVASSVILDVVANAAVVTNETAPCTHTACGYKLVELPCWWDPDETCSELVARCEHRLGYDCLLVGFACWTTPCLGTITIPGGDGGDEPPDELPNRKPVYIQPLF